MNIHVVQPGETIDSIAELYGVPVTRLIMDNELNIIDEMVPGQTIVIVYPEQSYVVQDGDTLLGIANSFGVTVKQLLRNNPYLVEREFIYPGETLVIKYQHTRGQMESNGFANVFVKQETLLKTLPYLTYLSILGYETTENADIIPIDDSNLLQLARDFGVAPILLLSAFMLEPTTNDFEESYRILYNDELVNRHIQNILAILTEKDYYGVNIAFQYITADNLPVYENYVRRLTERLNFAGYAVFITLIPIAKFEVNEITFERINYSGIGNIANGITLMGYNWGFNSGPPSPVTSIYLMRQFVEYVVSMVPAEKIMIGIPNIAYDWQLPYVLGLTKAQSLTLNSALALAREVGATIQFDDISKTPYFEYIDPSSEIPYKHIVWFIDARTIDSIFELIPEFGLKGSGIWNIMDYYPQLWLIMNSQFEILPI
ncbi:MAG: hypothetical protein K0S47_3324 [Herbinix sp.]|jgi:spore germination protein|nr:hypothetical protein [Herbinix sp.]